jgi:hypothetical protein
MCTVSWISYPSGGYELFFNRDEQRSRPQASPPELRITEGESYLAPYDGLAGGTWLATNTHGLTLCLLNWYGLAPMEKPQALTSRGHLIPALVASPSIDIAGRVLSQMQLSRFAPFHLLFLERFREPLILGWNGADLREERSERRMRTSSSFDTARVIAWRGRLFDELGDSTCTSEGLRRFHAWRDPAASAESICMGRADACTVSRTHVQAGGTQAVLRYECLDGDDVSTCCSLRWVGHTDEREPIA